MQKFSQKIFHIFTHIFTIFAFIFLTNEAVFASHPFTDVKPTDAYHDAISELFDARIISNDGSNLFRPNDPMNRDFFVSLTTAIGCKECLTPTSDDIIKFDKSPFIDLPKSNQFYYCIAHSANEGVTQGYNIDPNIGSVSCENGENFSSSPFCAENKISRIEAAAMLLRRAKLWDDNKNSGNFEKKENFSDVSEYWYGYAQKSLEIGILNKKSDNSIGQDEKISRGEFAIMASKILAYTQCDFISKNRKNTIASHIEIIDENGKILPSTTFIEGENIFFTPKTEDGNWTYSWTATPMDGNNSPISGNDKNFPGKDLPPGKWKIDVTIKNPNGDSVSNPHITVTILPKNPDTNADTDGDGTLDINDKCPTIYGPKSNNGCPLTPNTDDTDGDGVTNNNDKCPTIPWPASNAGCPYAIGIGVSITTNPSVTHIGSPVTFTPVVNGNTDNLTYNWDFGDGTRSGNTDKTTHTYDTGGTYPVTLTITDNTTGNTAQATVIVRITDDKDSDGDGILDSTDQCKNVKWIAPTGCPDIKIPDYGCTIRGVYNGNINCNHPTSNDTDGDGVTNDNDKCPTIPWPVSNAGCPDSNDTDGDWLPDPKDPNSPNNPNNPNGNNPTLEDHCPYVPWPASNLGCPTNGDGDDDGDGILNKDDRCPTRPWKVENFGCPNAPTDSDGDGINDDNDRCPQVRGIPEWQGCPNPSTYDNITQNICLLNKLNTTGLITGAPSCKSCPCDNSVQITSTIRECDVIFPTILSPDKKTIYSRGNFYLYQ